MTSLAVGKKWGIGYTKCEMCEVDRTVTMHFYRNKKGSLTIHVLPCSKCGRFVGPGCAHPDEVFVQ